MLPAQSVPDLGPATPRAGTRCLAPPTSIIIMQSKPVPSSSVRRSRAELALEQQGLNIVHLKALGNSASAYAPSTLQKNELTLRVYKSFLNFYAAEMERQGCDAAEVAATREPFPIDPERAKEFLIWLAEAGYRVSSIKTVFAAGLKRLARKPSGEDCLGDSISAAIKHAVRWAKANGHSLEPKKAPTMLPADLGNLLRCMPDHWHRKAEFQAMLLLGALTGARACTISELAVRDILQMTALPDGRFMLRLAYRFLKGQPHSSHTVNLEGRLVYADESDPARLKDPVFWLAAHLWNAFGVDLRDPARLSTEFARLKTLDPASRLFPVSVAALSSRVAWLGKQAGYPAGFFSFHSLRSGFLVAAMFSRLGQPCDQAWRTSVLEETGFIAQWVANSQAQLGYIREVIRRAASATRIATGSPCFLVAEMFEPKAYHGLAAEPRPLEWADVSPDGEWSALFSSRVHEAICAAGHRQGNSVESGNLRATLIAEFVADMADAGSAPTHGRPMCRLRAFLDGSRPAHATWPFDLRWVVELADDAVHVYLPSALEAFIERRMQRGSFTASQAEDFAARPSYKGKTARQRRVWTPYEVAALVDIVRRVRAANDGVLPTRIPWTRCATEYAVLVANGRTGNDLAIKAGKLRAKHCVGLGELPEVVGLPLGQHSGEPAVDHKLGADADHEATSDDDDNDENTKSSSNDDDESSDDDDDDDVESSDDDDDDDADQAPASKRLRVSC